MHLSRRQLIGMAALVGVQQSRIFPASCFAAESNWTSWRGANRDGLVENAAWPESFQGLQKLWSVPLHESYSGPIVSNGRVYTTETVKAEDETLVALDAGTGQVIWRKTWKGAMQVPFFAKANGDWIRSTPATDGERIVVGGMRDVVACFECETGNELWRVDFGKEGGAELPSFGLVCSPLIHGDAVYIQAGGSVRKMQLSDGKTIWQAMQEPGGMNGGAFSSPTIATINGKLQLVTQTRSTLCGIELESGNVLWQQDIKAFRGMNILTPTIWDNGVFTSSYGGTSQLIKVTASTAAWQAEVAWVGKSEAYMSSPLILDGHAYVHLKNNRFACVDLKTGEETWRTTPMGKYWSMVSNGNKILSLSDEGELRLIQADPTAYNLLDEKKVTDDSTWAHVAVVGQHIYVRGLKGLDCFQWV